MDKCCCNTGKTKHRDTAEYKALITRLNKIEGQVRGIKNMVENDRYCVDILTQVSAVQSALNSFNKILLSQHINEEVVDELLNTIQKIMK